MFMRSRYSAERPLPKQFRRPVVSSRRKDTTSCFMWRLPLFVTRCLDCTTTIAVVIKELSLQGNWFMISLSSRAGAASGRSVSTSGGGGLGGGPCCRLGRGGRRSGRWLWLAAGAMPVASCSKRGMVVRGERMCYVSGTLAERPVKEHRKFLFRKRTCDPTASGAASFQSTSENRFRSIPRRDRMNRQFNRDASATDSP